jgi:hypothetical protein
VAAVELEEGGEEREDEGEGYLVCLAVVEEEECGLSIGRTRSSSSETKTTLSTFFRNAGVTGGADDMVDIQRGVASCECECSGPGVQDNAVLYEYVAPGLTYG